jgi:uncharacterized protein YoxC
MALRSRARPHISLDAQLQQLTLFSDLDAENENLEQLGPIIKSLDEANQSDAFLRRLRDFVQEKETEIENVCNTNHQDFASAVDKLLKVRSGTVSLKHRISELNEEVQAGGQSLSSKVKKDKWTSKGICELTVCPSMMTEKESARNKKGCSECR